MFSRNCQLTLVFKKFTKICEKHVLSIVNFDEQQREKDCESVTSDFFSTSIVLLILFATCV